MSRGGDSAMKKIASLVAAAFLVTMIAVGRPLAVLRPEPQSLWVPIRQSVAIPWSRWLPIAVTVTPADRVALESRLSTGWAFYNAQSLALRAQHRGTYRLRFRVLGMIPFGSAVVHASAPVYVMPGGESIGILVRTRGLIVQGLSAVHTDRGISVDPAEAAGIHRGDVILKADGRTVDSTKDLDHIVARAGRMGKPLRLSIRQRSHLSQVSVQPVWSSSAKRFQLGVSLQDGATGVGTLTYVNPASGQFGALGHSLTDGLTRFPASVASGRVVGADIIGIARANRGIPGQKVGVLATHSVVSGKVITNGKFGIRGQLTQLPTTTRSMPVAFPDQVHRGPARLLTVLHGQSVRAYRIEIVRAVPQDRADTKGILFKVTDPQMLRITGGIVQGMSGSPILQDGRLVGAVTHVMVGEPTRGYGCYAVWMLGLAPAS